MLRWEDDRREREEEKLKMDRHFACNHSKMFPNFSKVKDGSLGKLRDPASCHACIHATFSISCTFQFQKGNEERVQ